eukprot:1535462-Rhodomonas_salina.1
MPATASTTTARPANPLSNTGSGSDSGALASGSVAPAWACESVARLGELALKRVALALALARRLDRRTAPHTPQS